jgi:hypothetical protein
MERNAFKLAKNACEKFQRPFIAEKPRRFVYGSFADIKQRIFAFD